jgi:LuxR family transcriptional regulator, maltose regulon positive regulatory protein
MERSALVDWLLASDERVVTIVAPPGYGKSTLLDQWRRRRGARVAWVSCDRIHDDPLSLANAVAAALGASGPPGAEAIEFVDGDASLLAQSLMDTLGALPRTVAIALDQVEALSSRDSRKLVRALATVVPAGSQLVLASRDEMPFPTARMRVQRGLLEIGTDDLAMSSGEASSLFATAGVEASDAETDQLVQQTEGWPAGLYLAALAIRAGEASARRGVRGDERLLADYLRSEVLDHIPPRQVTFLLRTSILERLNGGLGDAVAGGDSATRLLERLKRRNLLVEPLDGRGEWCRYPHLLREMLRAEVRRDSPDLIPELHARASAWFEAEGDLEEAIEHAQLAGDTRRFGRLVLDAMQPVWASGHADTVQRWMERLGHRSPAAHTPAMIAHGALLFAMLGQAGDAERWAAVAEGLPATGSLPDGSTVEGTLAYLRANLCRDSPAAMRGDAVAALEGLSPASPYRATMVHTEGLSYLLQGDLEQADASFAHAYDLAASIDSAPLAALVLAEQFLIAVERDEWSAADSLIKRSLEIISEGPFENYWTSALVYAAAAHAAVHRGNMPEARQYVRQAARLRPLLTYALPVVSVQALLELARTYLALIDPAGVRAVLEQIRGILRQRPELGNLVTATRLLDERVGQIIAATPIGASSLTTAEIRLVPWLPTRLTYSEIGEKLFISRHTVKTQATSMYHKLGASSRSEAVDRMIELGLV